VLIAEDKEGDVKQLKWVLLAIGLIFVLSLTLVIMKGMQEESKKRQEQTEFESQSIDDVRSEVQRRR